MPTTRPRHQVTETDEIAAALDAAALHWPGESRSRLLVRLIVNNGHHVADTLEADAQRRIAALRDWDVDFSAEYPPGYLDDLRAEWPE